jgi:hypothetical protein
MIACPSFSAICMNCGFWNIPLMACMYLEGSKLAGSMPGGIPGIPGMPGKPAGQMTTVKQMLSAGRQKDAEVLKHSDTWHAREACETDNNNKIKPTVHI